MAQNGKPLKEKHQYILLNDIWDFLPPSQKVLKWMGFEGCLEPKCSMYGIFTYIYIPPKLPSFVGK